MVAQQLTKQLRDHVDARGSMFSDDGYAGAGSLSLGSREERPILCIFERNFDLAAALQHAWTYAPLVHDVLDMRLNRVDITQGSSALDAAAALLGDDGHGVEDQAARQVAAGPGAPAAGVPPQRPDLGREVGVAEAQRDVRAGHGL